MTHISQSAAKTTNVTRQQTARDKIRTKVVDDIAICTTAEVLEVCIQLGLL